MSYFLPKSESDRNLIDSSRKRLKQLVFHTYFQTSRQQQQESWLISWFKTSTLLMNSTGFIDPVFFGSQLLFQLK